MREAVIVSSVRTAVGKAGKGTLRQVRPDDMAAAVIRAALARVPAVTPEAEAMSKALKKAGFTFVGPTICYAFMQASGMVMDHTTDCDRYAELS